MKTAKLFESHYNTDNIYITKKCSQKQTLRTSASILKHPSLKNIYTKSSMIRLFVCTYSLFLSITNNTISFIAMCEKKCKLDLWGAPTHNLEGHFLKRCTLMTIYSLKSTTLTHTSLHQGLSSNLSLEAAFSASPNIVCALSQKNLLIIATTTNQIFGMCSTISTPISTCLTTPVSTYPALP